MSDTTIPVTKSASLNQAVKSALINQAEGQKPNLPTMNVKLPSQGVFYPSTHPLAGGTVDIYQVTARHEDILSNATLLRKGTVLDEFIKALIATQGVTINDLLIGDKNALYVAARRSAYGDIYSTKIKCPECGEESVEDIDLSQLTNKQLNLDGVTQNENRISYTLPNSGKAITIGLLTHKDETDIDAELKALAKFSGNNAPAPEITTRLRYTIKSVNGDSDKLKIKSFVENELTAKDSLALRKFVREKTPDIDMNFNFTCTACGYQGRVPVPLDANFFWPNITE